MKIVAFKKEHLLALHLQPAQAYFGAEICKPGYADALAGGPAFTAFAGGQIIGCGGCVEIWDNRAQVWALVDQSAGRHMVGVHKAVAGFLLAAPWKRIEAAVDVGFEAGRRWIELLGFTNETPAAPMRAYRPDGGNCWLYAKVKS